MRLSVRGRWGVVGLALLALSTGALRAEDERGRWSFSFGLGVHSTFDDIRSNAGSVITCDSGDLNCDGFDEVTGLPIDDDLANDNVKVADPRQDDLSARLTKVEEKQRIDFSAAYGLTSWLSVQVDTGLYRGDVAPLDVFVLTERWPTGVAPNTPGLIPVQERVSQPLTVGQLTQIPLSVNAMFRFRRDSPFNPFMGIGVGYMFNDLKIGGAFNELNNRILRGFNRVMGETVSLPGTESLFNLQQIFPRYFFPEITPSSGLPADLDVSTLYNVDCAAFGAGESPGITNVCTGSEDTDGDGITDLDINDLDGDGDRTERLDTDLARIDLLPTQPFIHASVDDGFMYQFSLGADYHFNERTSAYVVARYQATDSKVSVRIRGPRASVTSTGAYVVNGTFNVKEASFRFIADTNPPAATFEQEGRFQRVNQNAPAENARPDNLQEIILVQGGDIGLTSFTVGAGIRFSF